MAILGADDYLCELCRFFNTDGIDGNHPYCMKQDIDNSKAVKLNDICPYGWKFGIPDGYPSSIESNRKRARELLDKIYGGTYVHISYDCAYVDKCHERICFNKAEEWSKNGFGTTTFCCSECGAHYIDGECYFAGLADADEHPIDTNYCPNCGAKVMNHD